jgi:magnesium transporter
LVLEDILNTHQRPKLEEHEDYLYIVLKSLAPDNDQFNIAYEQVSLIVLKNFVFAFKEKTDSLFSLVATRIENSHGRVRSLGSDYLMYSLLDTIVDQNFGILDQLDETLAALEDDIFTDPTPKMLEKIHQIKLEVIKMRRYISPVRDLSANLLRSESELIKPSTQIYLRDVHDHVMRIIESIETHRDILSSLLDIYLSSVSSKLNEVMKILTIFSAIFIPLTFVAGIYGMNFKHMPELDWKWGYPGVWVVFITIATSLYFFFKRKGWV